MQSTPILQLPYHEASDSMATFPADVSQPLALKLETAVAPAKAGWWRAAAVTVPASTPTTVVFDTATYTAANITYSGGTFTIQVAGVYLISAMVCWPKTDQGYRQIRMMKNGAIWATATAGPLLAADLTTAITRTMQCVVGDQLSIVAHSNAATSLLIAGTYQNNAVDIVRMGA